MFYESNCSVMSILLHTSCGPTTYDPTHIILHISHAFTIPYILGKRWNVLPSGLFFLTVAQTFFLSGEKYVWCHLLRLIQVVKFFFLILYFSHVVTLSGHIFQRLRITFFLLRGVMVGACKVWWSISVWLVVRNSPEDWNSLQSWYSSNKEGTRERER